MPQQHQATNSQVNENMTGQPPTESNGVAGEADATGTSGGQNEQVNNQVNQDEKTESKEANDN